jgi:hypothetical protein
MNRIGRRTHPYAADQDQVGIDALFHVSQKSAGAVLPVSGCWGESKGNRVIRWKNTNASSENDGNRGFVAQPHTLHASIQLVFFVEGVFSMGMLRSELRLTRTL